MSNPFSAASTDASTSATNGSLLNSGCGSPGSCPKSVTVIAGPPSVSWSSTTRSAPASSGSVSTTTAG